MMTKDEAIKHKAAMVMPYFKSMAGAKSIEIALEFGAIEYLVVDGNVFCLGSSGYHFDINDPDNLDVDEYDQLIGMFAYEDDDAVPAYIKDFSERYIADLNTHAERHPEEAESVAGLIALFERTISPYIEQKSQPKP